MSMQVQSPKHSKQPISEQQQEVLLAEYDFCLRTGHQMQTNIWQSAALFITLSTVGLSFVIQFEARTWPEQLLKALVALVPAIILAIWQRILDRWNAVQLLEYARTSQIERVLRMQRQLYHNYAKDANAGHSTDWASEEIRSIDGFLIKRYGKYTTHTYISCAIWFLCALWVTVAIVEGAHLF